MATKETAEKKLLKMIEDSGGQGESADPKAKQRVKKKQNTLSLIRKVNKLLLICVLGSLILLGNEIIAGASLLKSPVKFNVKQKNARRGRNPQTGRELILDSRKVVTFKPSGLLRDRINKGE